MLVVPSCFLSLSRAFLSLVEVACNEVDVVTGCMREESLKSVCFLSAMSDLRARLRRNDSRSCLCPSCGFDTRRDLVRVEVLSSRDTSVPLQCQAVLEH